MTDGWRDPSVAGHCQCLPEKLKAGSPGPHPAPCTDGSSSWGSLPVVSYGLPRDSRRFTQESNRGHSARILASPASSTPLRFRPQLRWPGVSRTAERQPKPPFCCSSGKPGPPVWPQRLLRLPVGVVCRGFQASRNTRLRDGCPSGGLKTSGAVLGVQLLVELPPLVGVGIQDGLVDLYPQPGSGRDRHTPVFDAIHAEDGVGKQLVP